MLSLNKKKWIFSDPSPDECVRLMEEAGVSSLIAKLLVNRKLSKVSEAKYLVDGDLSSLHDPFLMKGMTVAVDRIVKAIENGELLTVFADYDVDGVSSAAFLIHFFRDLRIPIKYYLPNRMVEGYGLSVQALESIKETGSSLIITADCGITAIKEAVTAKEMGLDVIITDHHQVCAEGLPQALAVLNPHQPDCPYPFQFLCGVGIVMKLATAIRSTLYRSGWEKSRLPNLRQYLDLFALGTIADVAPLTGENHVLTKLGLEVLTSTQKPGLIALKSVAGLNGTVNSQSVGFGLGPRLNAAGRLGKADSGLHLLISQDLSEATELANGLETVNRERQDVQKWTQKEAEYLIAREVDIESDRVIVLASENFHRGVVGIVASRMVERFFRPTVLIAIKDGVGNGSGRSIPKFNLFKGLQECSKFFQQFGGHAFASGLTLEASKIGEFRQAFKKVGEQYLTPDDLIPEVKIDCELNLADITFELIDEINRLSPFGAVNPMPVLTSRNVELRSINFIGKEANHVRFKVLQENTLRDVIAFNMRSAIENKVKNGDLVDIVYEASVNEWHGNENIQLKLTDISISNE
jgi:single-stranded-DNA-specific exonuclease